MKVILSYLDNMFMNMPQTPEVCKAKEELAAMMEDKYNELMAEGKKENEAVGIVISEFGDLEEIAEELGLKGTRAQKTVELEKTHFVSRKEAEEYMSLSKKMNKWIAFAVTLCIYSPILLFISGTVEGLTELQTVCYGLVPLFLMVAAAVVIFIVSGAKLERFEYLTKEKISVDPMLKKELEQLGGSEKASASVKTAIGTVCCILSVIPLILLGSISENTMVQTMGLVFMFILVGIGVAILIIGGNKMECIKVLCQTGDFSPKAKRDKKLIDSIGEIYWAIATAAYLIWSFTTMNWGFTWILWPVAGILFAAIAVVCKLITGEK